MDVDQERAQEIAMLNDVFRKSGMRCLITRGIATLRDQFGLMRAVRLFNDFNEDNDPWCEHDFGALEWDNQKVFWKIDYYDQELRAYRDPLEEDCKRMLTVLLAEEY
jgi:hypothetical protein